MKEPNRILFVSQQIYPFLDQETPIRTLNRKLPEWFQANGYETRTFMPKFGDINERRNQLHEVIRLSGINLIISETDHPLIIKVASIQSARIQIYFIDNDDYFYRRKGLVDANGEEYKDNDERCIFFARGVLETVKKLRWVPEVIHCQGWISSFIPMFIKTIYAEEPCFRDCRTVYTPSHPEMCSPVPQNMEGILNFSGVGAEKALEGINDCDNIQILNHMGIKWADGTALLTADESLKQLAEKFGKPVLDPKEEAEWGTAYPEFYDFNTTSVSPFGRKQFIQLVCKLHCVCRNSRIVDVVLRNLEHCRLKS